MSPGTTKWRVEERDGETVRALTVEAPSWEVAVQSAWTTWELPHELRRAGVEVGLSATQIFIRGTPQSYRVAPEATPRKRVVPRPVSSLPPPLLATEPPDDQAKTNPVPGKAIVAQPAPAPPATIEPAKPVARKVELRKVDAKPNGRSLFGKLPRASSPDLEQEARASRASQPDAEEAKARAASQPDPVEVRAKSRPDPVEAAPEPADEPVRRSSPSRPPVPFEVASAVEKLSRPRTPASPFPLPPRLPEGLPVVPTPASVPVQVAAKPAAAPAKPKVEPPPAAQVSGRRLQVLVSGAVQLYTREQDPKNGAPVVYRQRGYALPMGTEEHEGEAFGRWMLQQLQQQIPKGETPRLFHLAVYDEMFTGDPPILALCKLEWKEWKNETNVTFPRRGDDSVMAAPRARTPSMHPPDPNAPPVPPPGSPTSNAGKAQGRVAALFLPPVTPPSFAIQPAAPGAGYGREPRFGRRQVTACAGH